jgi:L-alanine-DL-glutamate epimerase-like enolase superfamily enzyme
MKSIVKEIAEKTRLKETAQAEALKEEMENPRTPRDRRDFLKKVGIGGLSLAGMMHLSIEDTIAQTTQKVSRASSPSDLRITDLRVLEKGNTGFGSRIVRIYTNQGITGVGDSRDGCDQRFVLALKPKIVGMNPCNVEMIFRVIQQFGGPGYKGAAVAAVEMACWDIAGKAFGVPVWQLLGGRYRDKVRLYADTPGGGSPEQQLANLKHRMETQGLTWLKMDMSLLGNPGNGTNTKFWGVGQPRPAVSSTSRPLDTAPRPAPTPSIASEESFMGYRNIEGPFTQIQITDKGIEEAAARVQAVRDMTGPEIPISSDHFGYLDENQFIRLCKSIDKYRLAWLEDCFPWFYTERWKRLTQAVETPVCTGETMYCLNGVKSLEAEGCFKTLLDAQAVDIIQPDLCSNGGILSTKRVGDYAELVGIPMAIHHNSSPVMFMAGVHAAAATKNFLALEHHHLDDQWWNDLVIMTDGKPIWENGYANVPMAPGLGFELNEENWKAQLSKGKTMFEPTPEWDNDDIGPNRISDKLWI